MIVEGGQTLHETVELTRVAIETPTDRIDKRGRLMDSFRDAPILIAGFLLPYDPRNSANPAARKRCAIL